MRWSVIGTPVSSKVVKISVTLAPGLPCFRTAHAPATCGADIDVPCKVAKSLPGTEEVILEPGANSDKKEALLEKLQTLSAVVPPEPSSVHPTLTAVEMQAGDASALV